MENDLISRQDAIKEVARWSGYLDDDMILRIQTGLKKLPSAQPDIILSELERYCTWSKTFENLVRKGQTDG